jgi:serine/threonine-protein kinase
MIDAHEAQGGILDTPSPATPPGADSPGPDELGQRVRGLLADRYRIQGELGRGGMATVFLAEELKHARPVVLKFLNPEVAALWSTDRFEREVQVAARLGHPHIVGLIDSGEADGLLYYVMPYIEGETLADRIEREGPLALNDALSLLRDIADALAYAHRMGVVHRDLKPSNVWCAGRHAYLLDFGIAKLLRPDPDQNTITQVGAAIGTPAYMAPEQKQAELAIDHRTDLYGWGLLAFEMLTGELPRNLPAGSTPYDVLVQRRPDLAPEVAQVIDRCLEPDLARRLDRAEIILKSLDSLVVSSRAMVPEAVRRHALPLALATLVVVATSVAAVMVGRPGSSESAGGAGGGLSGPVAVAAFTNETGDPALDTWGRMAGDWLTQGLQEIGTVEVVPWTNARQASDLIRSRQLNGAAVDPVQVLLEETGAASVVTGSYYLVNDSIQFRVQISDAVSGSLLGAPPAVVASRDSIHVAVRTLRDRIKGAVAILTDARFQPLTELASHPPLYLAYQAFDHGLERYNEQDYSEALVEFRRAYDLDSTFIVSMLYAATAHWNRGEYQSVDSVLSMVRRHENELSDYHRYQADFLEAFLAGDGPRALAAIRLAAAAAPGSEAVYRLADVAVKMDRPSEALAALESLEPDRGTMRGWSAYWLVMTHALHLLGEHERELEAARTMRRQYPDRRIGLALEARALGALGDVAALDSMIDDARSLPPTTYWSQGAAMVVAGEELQAHGWADEGRTRLEEALVWFSGQLELHPGERRHRYWLASAHYDLGHWEESAALFAALAGEYGRFGYRGMAAVSAARLGDDQAERLLPPPDARASGSLGAYRGRIAAIRGDTTRAVILLADAVEVGVDDLPWLHATAFHDLQLLGGSSAMPRSLMVNGWSSRPAE